MSLRKEMDWISAFVLLFGMLFSSTKSAPLVVKSQWMTDQAGGSRVKLACVNCISHMQPMIIEGLERQALINITDTITSQGFNCVRLTWATFMFTDPAYRNLTVENSLNSLNLTDAVTGITANNPDFIGLTLIEAYKKVVAGLGEAGIMIILDNHISKPQWCCGYNDGNGFFGDEYFDPQVWIRGLSTVASTFKNSSHVVAMSLRNELRGSRSNADDWYKYMQQGAKAVHEANPNVIVILSGLNYDSDLKFLASKPVDLAFTDKIAYEMHWYAFTDGNAWAEGNPNEVCASVTSRMNENAAFIAASPAPLIISEFGIDQRGTNVNDNRYINCFLAFAAGGDFDWALWTLQGSYYSRDDKPGSEETYGVFNDNWDGLRNPSFLSRLKSIQQPFQDPFSSQGALHQLIYHPSTGLCINVGSGNTLKLDSCNNARAWNYSGQQGSIGLVGKSECIGAQGNGLVAVLTAECSTPNSLWQSVSASKLQIAVNATVKNTAQMLCLDGSSSPSIFTNDCICSMDSSCDGDPESQWFKLITTTRNVSIS
eukprot:Gb_13276 [translate_table: standard]